MGAPVAAAGWIAVVCVTVLLVAAFCDYTISVRAWRRASPRMTRRLPAAFAIGAKRPVRLGFEIEGCLHLALRRV